MISKRCIVNCMKYGKCRCNAIYYFYGFGFNSNMIPTTLQPMDIRNIDKPINKPLINQGNHDPFKSIHHQRAKQESEFIHDKYDNFTFSMFNFIAPIIIVIGGGIFFIVKGIMDAPPSSEEDDD